MEHELGIKPEQVPLDDFKYLTRIHYVAPSDGLWGEHESKLVWEIKKGRSKEKGTHVVIRVVDYIFFIKANVTMDVNANEVRDVKWVTPEELRAMFADPGKVGITRGEGEGEEGEKESWKQILMSSIWNIDVPMTPWFKLICNSFLFNWWAKLDTIESEKDEKTIHRLGF